MPIYDYRCLECGNQVEVMHAIDGSGPAQCEVCGGAMRKALSPPAIHFRGSGWAKKDARSSARKDRSRDASKDGATESATSDDADKGASTEPKGGSSAPSKTTPPPTTPSASTAD